jgi:hypothetical protein
MSSIRARRLTRLAVTLQTCFAACLESVLMTDLFDLFHAEEVDEDMEFGRLPHFSWFVAESVGLPVATVRLGNRSRLAVALADSASRFVYRELGVDPQPDVAMVLEVNAAWRRDGCAEARGMARGAEPEFEPVGDSIFASSMQHGDVA